MWLSAWEDFTESHVTCFYRDTFTVPVLSQQEGLLSTPTFDRKPNTETHRTCGHSLCCRRRAACCSSRCLLRALACSSWIRRRSFSATACRNLTQRPWNTLKHSSSLNVVLSSQKNSDSVLRIASSSSMSRCSPDTSCSAIYSRNTAVAFIIKYQPSSNSLHGTSNSLKVYFCQVMGLTFFSKIKSYAGQVLSDSRTKRSTLVLEVEGFKRGVDCHSLLQNTQI